MPPGRIDGKLRMLGLRCITKPGLVLAFPFFLENGDEQREVVDPPAIGSPPDVVFTWRLAVHALECITDVEARPCLYPTKNHGTGLVGQVAPAVTEQEPILRAQAECI